MDLQKKKRERKEKKSKPVRVSESEKKGFGARFVGNQGHAYCHLISTFEHAHHKTKHEARVQSGNSKRPQRKSHTIKHDFTPTPHVRDERIICESKAGGDINTLLALIIPPSPTKKMKKLWVIGRFGGAGADIHGWETSFTYGEDSR